MIYRGLPKKWRSIGLLPCYGIFVRAHIVFCCPRAVTNPRRVPLLTRGAEYNRDLQLGKGASYQSSSQVLISLEFSTNNIPSWRGVLV